MEIVTEGFIFIEELTKSSQEAARNLNEKLAEIHFAKDNIEEMWLEKSFNLKRSKLTPNTSIVKSLED